MMSLTESALNNKKIKILSLVVILVLTLIVFSNSVNNSILFGWDDGEYISNKDIQEFRLNKFFSTYYLGMYQPLAVMSLSLNYHLSEINPAPYHATNLLLHLVNIVLVFLLFLKITKRFEVTFIVTILFAIHPMHVEAVSWIATRSNGLYSVFFLVSLIYYLRYLDDKVKLNLIYSFIFFLLSCFSKSMAITLPAILFLLDYFKNRKYSQRVILEKIPFIIMSVVFGLIAMDAASEYGHIRNLDVNYNFSDRLVLPVYSIIFYLVKALAPANLSAVYAYPAKENDWLPWEYYFSILVFVFLIINIIKSGKLKRDVIFGMLFFFLSISVVLPLVWSRMLMLADRYTYLPYLGIFYIVAQFYLKIADGKTKQLRNYKTVALSLFIGWIVFLSATSFHRNKVWKDAITLTTDVIEKDRSDLDVSIGYFFRGNILDIGNDLQHALSDYNKAIQLNPAYTLAYNNRGIIKGSIRDYEGAIADFNKAVELEPGYADAIYNRGNVHYYLGNAEDACRDWYKAKSLGSKQAELILSKYCK
jgi:hypothetical protein